MRSGNSCFDSVCIKSTGSYVPSKILTNEEVLANLPTSPEWVVEKMGIRERHIAGPDEYTSDLAARAGLDAIASAGLEPNEIDLIIVSTATPDRKMPSSACIAQAKMGIRNRCAAFDSGGGMCRVCLRHHDRRPIHPEWYVRACAGRAEKGLGHCGAQ